MYDLRVSLARLLSVPVELTVENLQLRSVRNQLTDEESRTARTLNAVRVFRETKYKLILISLQTKPFF